MADAQLPTQEDIAKLPRWAQVAFAARCARRAFPLFAKHWPEAPSVHLEAVEQAVSVAEVDAARAAYDDAFSYAAARATTAAFAAYDADDDARTFTDSRAFAAARAAADAAIRAAHAAATRAADAGISVTSIARDFKLIRDRATSEQWTDKTPVPPSVFGPLDDSEPTSVVVTEPAEPPKNFKLVIDAYANTASDPQEVADRLVELYAKLDEYCRLKYGRGLTLKEFDQHVCVGARIPVGGGS